MAGPFPVLSYPGLSEEEARARLLREGANEVPAARHKGLLALGLSVISEPMIALLVSCGTIYFFLGDRQEAVLLFSFVLFVISVTLYQERKTERALDALRDLGSPRALVNRDGRQRRIPGREVVPEDILVLDEGDRVPADAVLLSATGLSWDESLLTGESVPVRKAAQLPPPLSMERPGGEDRPFVYSGTLVVKGHGVARVLATGPRTEMGRIGKALGEVREERTPLQREMARVVRVFALVGVVLCVAVAVIYGLHGGLHKGAWLKGLLAGLTLAMSVLPEEIPMILTIFFALGAWRISRNHVLTRRLHAIETLGSATVLCVDKTGTLTVNRMSVSALWDSASGAGCAVDMQRKDVLPEEFHQVVEFGILASQEDPHDPMELAFLDLARRYLAETEHIHRDYTLVREYPLSRDLLAVTQVWRTPQGAGLVVAAKGAPEAIFGLCRLDAQRRQVLSQEVDRLAGDGLRVLAVARAPVPAEGLPADPHGFAFSLVGLIGLLDPVRSEVPAAIQECYGAGIRVVMITGDHATTAQSIARRIGLRDPGVFVSGPEMDTLTDEALSLRAREANLFVRVVPEQKLRLVQALQRNGEVVAMTGDGVNDAPALKAAHIGVAMGGRGTDVAREAAALTLLDDNFSSIVAAIRLGRRIFDNLRKALGYTLAIHVPIAGMTLVPVLLGWPLILLPIHIAILEMVIDPACSVIFEAEPAEAGVMARPPRDPRAPVVGRRMLVRSLLQGAMVMLAGLVVFGIALHEGLGEGQARALGFSTLMVANLGLILVNRSLTGSLLGMLRTPNRPLWLILGAALVLGALVFSVPWLQHLFAFGRLRLSELAIAVGAGAFSVVCSHGLNAWQEGSSDQRKKGQRSGEASVP